MQPVKQVLQTRDTAACVLLDLKEITVRFVSFWGTLKWDCDNYTLRSLRLLNVSGVKNSHCAAVCYVNALLNER